MAERRAPTGIDLFCGCGGFSLGFARAGFEILVAVDNDVHAVETYRRNRLGKVVWQRDIRDVTPEELLEAAGLERGKLDMLFGGPPCQGFSVMSKNRSLDNPKSKLMHEFIRLLQGIEPRMFLIENVPGLFSYKDFFVYLMETLEDDGRYVVRCLMMDAASYGVPQYRKRIFIEGFREDLKALPVFPRPTHFSPEMLKVKKGEWFSRAAVTVEAFAVNGFPKEEIRDLWWNTKLHIQMNRKTAADVVDVAVNTVLLKGIKRALDARSALEPVEAK